MKSTDSNNFNKTMKEAEQIMDEQIQKQKNIYLPLQLSQCSMDFTKLSTELQEILQSDKFEGFSKNTKIVAMEKLLIKMQAGLELLKD